MSNHLNVIITDLLCMMQYMADEGVLGVKILTLKIQKFSGDMFQIPLAWHAYACCCFSKALPYNVKSFQINFGFNLT